ncbi:MAG: MtsA protein [Myxococcaceae bacterium]|nr:MtsA protein [Myxococcaceae bacterium]
MKPAYVFVALCLTSLSCRKADTREARAVPDAGAAASPAPRLTAVGPRVISNQTSQPLSVYGENLVAGAQLMLGEPINRAFPLTVLDGQHAFVRLPGDLKMTPALAEAPVAATLQGSPATESQTLRLVNDAAFPDLTAMVLSGDGRRLFIASTTEDTLYRVDLKSQRVTPIAVGDGPNGLALWNEAPGKEWVVVSHAYSSELKLVSSDGAEQKSLPAPAYAASVVVDNKSSTAFVSEHARDSVVALNLAEGAKELWRASVAPNPGPMALTPNGLWVGSLQTGQLERLDVKTGVVSDAPVQPMPGTPLLGPPTREMRRVKEVPATFSRYVMGGKAPRAVLWHAKAHRLLVASIGPNIGPNPQKMEVTMNSGVGVVDGDAKKWDRHWGFGAGVVDAMALDEAAGVLYAADDALGLVRVVDLRALLSKDGAKNPLLQDVGLPPPDGFPLVRPKDDFGVNDRAGVSLHSGPKALALSADKKTLYVLNRFTATVATLDVSQAAKGKAVWRSQMQVTYPLGQKTRRLGQVLYHADFGRTAMTCDTCHLEGHTESILFEKTNPLRIYRSTTLRGSRETPPHFTPAAHWSVGETVKVVGARNRYHNPDLTPEEIEALTLYASGVVTLPNPFVGADGAPVDTLTLPDGKTGHPKAGLALFEGKAGCAECHPAPHFTTDQDPKTRGRFVDVGTPHLFPLRPDMQDPYFQGFGAPSLLGVWDIFPLLTTGTAGLSATPEGAVTVDERFPLRKVVVDFAPKHGRANALSEAERDNLLAYLLSL